MEKGMKLKKYIAIFRDGERKELYVHRFFAYDIKQAREHARNMLAGSMQGDAKSVVVYRIYL